MGNTEYSVSDVVNLTGRTTETVRRWCRSGKLKSRKPAGTRDFIIDAQDFNMFWYGSIEAPLADNRATTQKEA